MTDDEILEEAKERFQTCLNYYSPLYERAREDQDFLRGQNQWDDKIRKARQNEGKLCLTVNLLQPYAMQVVNDIKKARLAVRVVPTDSTGSVDMAEMRAGIIRNIEKQSNVREIYGTAGLNAVSGGVGWIEIDSDYCDPESFDIEPKIKRVLDFESCMIDPSDLSSCGLDSDYGFKIFNMCEDEFEDLYPDADLNSFNANKKIQDGDDLTLVKYFWKEYETKKIFKIRLIDGTEATHDQEFLNKLDEEFVSYEILKERETRTHKVMQAILSNSEVLAKEEFPAPYIPLVPVYGDEYWANDQREFRSLIHPAKDAQVIYNFAKSENIHMLANSPRPKVMGAVGSFKSDAEGWANVNNQNVSTLEYDIVHDPKTGQIMPPPFALNPPQGSPALMQEAEIAKEDIRLSLGMPQSNMGERSNAVSGIAIRAQQVEGDNATLHFVDNLSISIAHVGRILNEMITVLYTDRKIARIIGEDGLEKIAYINQPVVKEGDEMRVPKAGETPNYIFDTSIGKYDIDIDTGPSYSSKRQETADKIIELARARPEVLDVAGDILFESLDLPQGRKLAERVRSMMSPELLADDPNIERLKEANKAIQAMQEQLANYDAALKDKKKNAEFEQNVELKKLEQEQQRIAIEAEKVAADIEKMRAETKGFDMGALNGLVDAISGIDAQVQDMGYALSIIMDAKEADMMSQENQQGDVTDE